MRPSGRSPDQLRDIQFTRNYTKHAEGSVLVEFGDTKVLCNASIEPRVPPWMRDQGKGWITAQPVHVCVARLVRANKVVVHKKFSV